MARNLIDDEADFHTITLLLSRQSALSSPSASVRQLIERIEGLKNLPERLEQTLVADRNLSQQLGWVGDFLELGSRRGNLSVQSTLIDAIGSATLAKVAIAILTINSLSKNDLGSVLNPSSCRQHCLFVGLLAMSCLRSRSDHEVIDSSWGEAFATGLLYDVPFMILAKTCPSSFGRIFVAAQRNSISLTETFEQVYKEPVWNLAPQALRGMGLPERVAECLSLQNDRVLSSVSKVKNTVLYAASVSLRTEFKLEPWEIESPISDELQAAASVRPDLLVWAIEEIRSALRLHSRIAA